MDCRHNILVNNRFLFVKISTRADYNYKSQITFREWLQLWRYEVGIIQNSNGQGYKWWINKSKSIW